jgi:nicotinamidase/pyrazinamidase
MTIRRTELLIIDPQVDFCDPKGALYVPGAERDMERLAKMVRRTREKLDDIHVTLDSHHRIHIAHPIFWKDSRGNHPPVFTRISRTDVEQGVSTATVPGMYRRALDYLRKLETNGRVELIRDAHLLVALYRLTHAVGISGVSKS